MRFTGGEPLLSRHLEEVVAATASLRPRPEISLTTNGVGLARRAAALAEAGLDRVNVSLDSVDRDHFAAITRRDRLADVLDGLAAAKEAGLTPVKVNAVLDPVTGREDVVELLRFCLEHGYQLRVIEQMPLDAGHQWRRDADADRRRCAGGAAPALPAAAGPGAARLGPGRALAGRHGPEHTERKVRCHRVGVARLLLDV